MELRTLFLSSCVLGLVITPLGCGDDTSGDGGTETETDGGTSEASADASADNSGENGSNEVGSAGDGDGDSDASASGDGDATAGDGDGTGDGDGDGTGDGDGDTTTGDGDGDSTTGDGDGDSTTGDGDGDGDSTTGDGDGDSTTGDGDGDSTTGDGDSTTGDGDGDSTSGGGVVCTKVDVIFAVDNSGSMTEEINALQGIFDTLPSQLLQVGNGIDDFNLAVINGCPTPGYFFNEGDGGACNYSTSANYMSSTSSDLLTEFACVMELNDNGYNGQAQDCQDSGVLADDDEQPASTIAAGLSPANLANQNLGFLRDDALLFVVAMSDEDEELVDGVGSPVLSQTVIDNIIAAKGDIDYVIFMGIGGDSDCTGPYGGADDAPNLKAIAQPFIDADRGIFWDLCGGDLPGAFSAAIQVVDEACNETPPPV